MKLSRLQKSDRVSGFSLVEISMVVAVLAIGFIPLVGMLPTGLRNFRGAMNYSICAQIAQRVVGDAAQADFDTLIDRKSLHEQKSGRGFTFRAPSIRHPELRYFDDQGTEIVPAMAGSLSSAEAQRVAYQVNVRVMPQASVPASDGGNDEDGDPDLALVTVEVAFATRSVKLEFSSAAADDPKAPDRNLLVRRPSLDVFTYSALIGRGL